MSFEHAVTALGGSAAEAGAVGRRLLARWREPRRRYHDERHLAEVLAAVAELGGEMRVVLAAWYHDAVYEGRPGDDEEASARLAETELADLGLAGEDVAAVAALVRSTTTHELPDEVTTPQEAVLHDADLWVLASPVARFDEYCASVREEYPHVSAEDFRHGRMAALTPFAVRDRVYATAHAHEHWTNRARANLARELDRLTQSPGP